MRLLNVYSLELEQFNDHELPPYAILSHTWGRDEISFQTLKGASYEEKKGFAKIYHAARVAQGENWQYIWIDTCCIDKTSSAELSEAINSMFAYYRGSNVCYAYLEDVKEIDQFDRSRW